MNLPPWADLPVTELCCPEGGRVVIADHGAHVLSWQAAAGGRQALFLSATSDFGAGSAIRGGIPLIFPQFAERGPGKRHGFARLVPWRRSFAGIEQGRAVARYVLDNSDIDASVWGNRFLLEYEIVLQAQQLQLGLKVSNTDRHAWSFNAALHTYLHVDDLAQVTLQGLQGFSYLDKVHGTARQIQQEDMLHICAEVDRVYAGSSVPLHLQDGSRSMTISQDGFVDTVVWQPGAAKAALIGDLSQEAAQSFLCVEAAAVFEPISLAPGASWQGHQLLQINN
jgi:glucose-6-phosphate 1-epimerase